MLKLIIITEKPSSGNVNKVCTVLSINYIRLSDLQTSLQIAKTVRQVKAWVERLKRTPTENAKILFNDTEGSE